MGTDTYRIAVVAIKRKDLKHAEFKRIFSVIQRYLEKQPEQMAQLMQSNHPLEIYLSSSYE